MDRKVYDSKFFGGIDFKDYWDLHSHYSRIRELFLESNELIIVSPFLMDDLGAFFNDLQLDKLNKIHLITILRPKSFDQILKINSLATFANLSIFSTGNTDFKVSINNRLHGKVYL